MQKSSLRTTQWFLKHVLQCLALKDDFFLNEYIATSITIEVYGLKKIRVYNNFLYLNILTNLVITKLYYILPIFSEIYYTKYLNFENSSSIMLIVLETWGL